MPSIDDAFEQHEEKLGTLTRELEAWEVEWKEKLQSQAAGEIARRERALTAFRGDAGLARSKTFDHIKRDIDISAHLRRYKEWKAEMLATFPILEVAARHFKEPKVTQELPRERHARSSSAKGDCSPAPFHASSMTS